MDGPQYDTFQQTFEGRTALICGSAPCLLQDLEEALKNRPDAVIFAINDAAAYVHADFLVTLHPEKGEIFKNKSQNAEAPLFTGAKPSKQWHTYPADYWFSNAASGATSAYSAVQIARKLKFCEIILCGCPMQGGDGYIDGSKHNESLGMGVRVGHAGPKHAVTRAHKTNLDEYARTEDCSMVSSMSGYTKQLFGGPAWQHRT